MTHFFSSAQRFSERFRSRRQRPSFDRFRQLKCEALEDRRLLAVIAGPQATLEVADVLEGGAAKHFLKVTYTDDIAIDVSSFDADDLQISSPPGTADGLSAIPVEFNEVDGTPRAVWYAVNAPDGTWNANNNGLYTVSIRGEQVFDSDNNPVEAGELGQFNVQIPIEPPVDTIRPTAVLEAGNILDGGHAVHPLHVIYSDNVAINVLSIDSEDLVVRTGPDGNQREFEVLLIEFGPDGDGTPRTARYHLRAPGGTWDAEDNGVYTVHMRPEQIRDTNGNVVEAGVLGTFEVAINTEPPVDTIRPTAVLEVGNILDGGGEAHSLHLIYSDNVAIDVSTIDSADLAVITGPDGVSLDVALVEFGPDGDGTPRTARYRVLAPGGTWDAEDNGVYSVKMRPEQVQDTSGNVVEAGVLGTFEVDIDPPVGELVQTVSGTMENISAVAGRRIHFAVEYSVSDFDNTLFGLGLRMHYDSTMLTFDGLKEVLETGFVQVQEPTLDTEDFDADPSTDQYVLISWANVDGNWPSRELPVELFATSFTTADNLPIETATAIRFTTSSTSSSHGFEGNPVEVHIGPPMDIDGDGDADALSDGILALRYLFGFRGDSLTKDVIISPSPSPSGAQAMASAGRTDSGEIALYLENSQSTLLDIDDDGKADALSDGILMLRYLFGFRGSALVDNAIRTGARRTDAVDVEDFLDAFLPMPSQVASSPDALQADIYQAFAAEAATASSPDTSDTLTDPAVDGVMGMLGAWDN